MTTRPSDIIDSAITQPHTSPAQFIPYGKQLVTDDDIAEVTAVLRSDFLTQGPAVPRFERHIAEYIGTDHVVACSNGTSALHLAMMALQLKPGDVVVTSPITFVASANCARYAGADVQFVDIDPATGLMDIGLLENLISQDTGKKIKAIIPVHFAGQPIDLARIHALAKRHGAWVVDDACHALGARFASNGEWFFTGGSPSADMTVFSFHPVKHIATGEGGAIATNNSELAVSLRTLRTHGITREDFTEHEMSLSPDGKVNPWYYEMQMLGYNYRLTDIQAALGSAQMRRLGWSVKQRREIAEAYRIFFAENFDPVVVRPLTVHTDVEHSWHLFVLQVDFRKLKTSRSAVMTKLREKGIGTQVHYIPVHLQPYYRMLYGHKAGDFPLAEGWYEKALSIPMYPSLTDDDVERVLQTIKETLQL
jgi:UDP-4-amino-4,6-dideoxy-N-acetyl-beta-L-altrosamine transaminase